MRIVTLDTLPPDALIAAFNDAFGDYAVTVEMTPAKLENVIRARSVLPERSYGILDEDRLAAFILTGSRRIDGRLVAYNAATGVCRDHQRRGLGRRLLTHAMGRLRAFGYRSYRLEVITTNTGARRLYGRQGFTEGRLLHCYTATAADLRAPGNRPPAADGAVVTAVDPHWADRMALLRSHVPSWQNADPAVDAIASHCRVVTTGPATAPAAMALLDPRFGTLHQFGFAAGETSAARRVLSRAMEHTAAGALHLINVDGEDRRMTAFLAAAGFTRTVSQLEMTCAFGPPPR